MRGLTYKTILPSGTTTHIVENPRDYRRIIVEEFGLPIDRTDQLWEAANLIHQQWLQDLEKSG